MPVKKKVTLNKAAVMMKKVKQKQNESSLTNSTVSYPIDAVSGKNPEQIQKQMLERIKFFKETSDEIIDAITFYSEIKTKIISANVESGLHNILCKLDMLKNVKQYTEMLLRYTPAKIIQNTAHNNSNATFVLINEKEVEDLYKFEGIIKNIVEDITRQDSKNSFMNTIVEIPTISEENLKMTLNDVTKSINDLEDKKFEINNTYKIELDVPDSLCDFLGI